jgi:sialidase-1
MRRGAITTRRKAIAGLALLLAVSVTGGEQPAAAAAAAADGGCSSSVPYRSGTQGYHTFRIPAVIRIGKRTVLAFAEGRRNSAADQGDIDTVLKRSSDGGCTWGRLQVVASGHGNTFGNPTPVADPRSGRIALLLCRTVGDGYADLDRNRQVYVTSSTDGGATWARPRDITSRVKPANWTWYATGPGHAIALRHGPFAGRLLAPANHMATTAAGEVYGAHSLYSDDGGTTWRIGYIQQDPSEWINLNENSLAELPDGRVYINARDEGGFSDATRADGYSLDGGLTVQGFSPQEDLPGPVVQGAVLQTGGGALLYSAPADPVRRARMAVRVSQDGGISWATAWTVSQRPAGYSDLVELEGGRVGLLYETGATSPYETITFARR